MTPKSHDLVIIHIFEERTGEMGSAATRRHDVAMGVSPWNPVPSCDLSPDGTTRVIASRIPVALSGLNNASNACHGLAPVATTCRPSGTEMQK